MSCQPLPPPNYAIMQVEPKTNWHILLAKKWGEMSQVFVDVAVIVTKCKILSGMANFLDGWNSDSDFEEADQTGEMKLCLFVEIQHRLCPFKLPSC